MRDDPDFFERDLSWLEFNARVLHEAGDERTPLLERVRFLAIFTNNLDEFVMKRLGGHARQRAAGLDTGALRSAIRQRILSLVDAQAEVFTKQLRPALAREGIQLVSFGELSREDEDAARAYFRAKVFPVLTPLAVDPGHPFPLVSNLSTSLAVLLRSPDAPGSEPLFARVKIPQTLPPWVPLPERGGVVRLLPLQELIAAELQLLFDGMTIAAVMPFRVTRNADVERDEEDAEDLLEMVTDELRERRFARPVRLEHGPNPDPTLLRLLIDELEVRADEVYELPAGLDFTTLAAIADLPRPALRYEPWTPVVPPAFGDGARSVIATVRAKDVLVHHPYESFAHTVLAFIQEAVVDPRVLAVKMTLYRTGDDSPFIPLLIRAAENGKQVACLVELKARFDEERNIQVARSLEKAGVHVVYGLVGLKTHCKTALVVREEPDGLRGYVHIGTGNYNAKTAQLYTDLGLFTGNPAIVEDVEHLFNQLTGRSAGRQYGQLLVAPRRMKAAFLERIEREAAAARERRPAGIIAKMNQLEDRDVVRALYKASAAGVPIELLVRGFCTLRPGVKGLSDNIRVTATLGRFLEHSRLFHFANGQQDPLSGEFFIGSADWMHRNLEWRVEAAVPVLDRGLRERLWEILTLHRRDERNAWDLQPDGTYVQRQGRGEGAQSRLMQLARARAASG